MRSENRQFRWPFLIFSLLLAIDLMVGLRAVQRLILHDGEISPDAPFFLLLLLVLQVALILLFAQWKRTIAEQQRLKEAYEHELELSRQIMENIESAIIVVDAEGRYVYANRATSELLELPSSAIVGQTADSIMVFPPGMNHASLMSRSLTESILVPVTLRKATGATVNVTVKVSPRWFAGRVVGAIASTVPAQPLPGEAVQSPDPLRKNPA